MEIDAYSPLVAAHSPSGLDVAQEQELVATQIQAVQRGRIVRKEQAQQADVAAKIQAIQRGRMARKEQQDRKAKAEQELVAIRIQAIQRGRIARKERLEQARATVPLCVRLSPFRGCYIQLPVVWLSRGSPLCESQWWLALSVTGQRGNKNSSDPTWKKD